MPDTPAKPIIFLAFANNRADPAHFLDKLAEEERRLRETLGKAAELCDVVSEETATADEILALFQQHRDRIAIFHFAGHANSYQLLLETADGQPAAANAGGFAAFLGQQTGLELVFLNGCSTQGQVEELLAANVPAVIATDQKIKDDVATDFAALFYGGLATGASIRSAFEQAKAGIRFKKGDKNRDLFEEDVSEASPASAIPWDLHALPDYDPSAWTLWEAAGNPLFGLPPLTEQPLPPAPFPGLAPYPADQAELFFGRGAEIRRLFDWAVDDKTPPILLLHGQTGVGKSSLLDAGLSPRLAARQQVRYLRRDPALGLTGTLLAALASASEEGSGGSQSPNLAARWRATKAQSTQALTVILDRADEALTRPAAGQADEYDALATALAPLFADPTQPGAGKLILACRQEALAPIRQALADHGLGSLSIEHPLDRLDRAGIMEAVRGPAQNARLRATYRVTVDDELPALVAEDLTTDDKSPIAPVLQVLLGEMWAQTSKDEPRSLGCSLYNAVRQDGYGLRAFLANQLSVLQRTAPDIVDSGWALDLLAEHATSLGAARERSLDELRATYPQHADALPGLIQRCQDLYLLTDLRPTPYGELAGQDHVHRLAHDTLALVVRQRYGESDLPGQRARRILEARAPVWADEGDGGTQPVKRPARSPLDDADLAAAEVGATGMRAWTDTERRLVDASRTARDRRQRTRKIVISSFLGLGIIIAIAAVIATWQANVATHAKSTAQAESTRAWEAKVDAEKQRGTAQAESTRALNAEADADRQRDTAVANAKEANRQKAIAVTNAYQAQLEARRARAGELAALSQTAFQESPQRSLLLVREAYSLTLDTPAFFAPTVEQVLRDNLQKFGGRPLSYAPKISQTAVSAALSPDGKWLAAGGLSWIRLWQVDLPQARAVFTQTTPFGGELLAFSRDGSRLVAAGMGQNLIYIWSLDDPKMPLTVLGRNGSHGTFLKAIDVSVNGRWIASAGGGDSTVGIWDAEHPEQPPRVIRQEGDIFGFTDVAFNPADDNKLAASNGKVVFAWNRAEENPKGIVANTHAADISAIAYSPDGKWLASAGRDGVLILSGTTAGGGRQRWPLPTPLTSLAFSRDGKLLAVGGDDSVVRVLTRFLIGYSSEVITLQGHQGSITALSFNEDGRFLVSASSDKTARIWDLSSPQALPAVLVGHDSSLRAVAISTESGRIATAAADRNVRLWDTKQPSTEPLSLGGHTNVVTSGVFSPPCKGENASVKCHRWLATASSAPNRAKNTHEILIWDLDRVPPKPTLLASNLRDVLALTFSSDRRWLAASVADRTVHVWSLGNTISETLLLQVPERAADKLVFTPDSQRLIAANLEALRFYDLDEPQSEPLRVAAPSNPRGPDFINAIALDQEGQRLAVASNDKTIRLLALDHPVLDTAITLAPGDEVSRLAFDPQGRWLVAPSGKNVLVWDIKALSVDPVYTLPHEGNVHGFAFALTGRRLATVSGNIAYLWNTDDFGKPPVPLQGQNAWIQTLAFSPDDEWLATSGGLLWHLPDSKFGLIKFAGDNANNPLIAFSPDGRQLLSSGTDGSIHLWTVPSESLALEICAVVGRNLTHAEWRQYFPTEPYRRTCSEWSEVTDQ